MARFQCTDCGYVYDESRGDPYEGLPPGTPWAQIPDDWSCPDCAVRDKVDFISLDKSVTQS
jgi:rubredoxin